MIVEGENQIRVPLDHSSEAKVLVREGGVINPNKGDEEESGEIHIDNTNEYDLE